MISPAINVSIEQRIIAWLAAQDTAAYLVGGWVRDRLLGRPNYDLDVTVAGDGLRLARRLADDFGGSYYPLDEERGTGRAILEDREEHRLIIDIASFRGLTPPESSSVGYRPAEAGPAELAADLADRDFTINALAVDVHAPEQIIDHHGGLADLEARLIRPVSDATIRNDPVRALRAVRQAAQLGFALAPETTALIRRDGAAVAQVSGERVRDEVTRLLALPYAAPSLEQLDDLGLLTVVLPELEPLRDLAQPPPHHLPALAHSLETVRAAQLEIRVEAEGRQRRLAESLRDTSHALSSTLNLTEVLQRLLQGVVHVLPSHRASVFLLEDNMLQRTVFWEETDSGTVPDLVIPLDADPLLSEVVEKLRAAVVRDARRDGRVTRHAQQELFASMIGVPLISHDRVAGVLMLENRKEGAYTDNEAQIAYTFAGQAGIAIENARLFGEVQRLATTDELTGILNRRQFFEIAEREFARARRYERPITAIMADVDHFKKVNDTYGHAVGDEVLKEIARRLGENIRDVDVLGRYGGEEFALLLPDTEISAARSSVAERLRAAVADTPISTEAGPLTVTISIGLAQRDDRWPDLASVLSMADRAMYRAKAAGRNRVETEE